MVQKTDTLKVDTLIIGAGVIGSSVAMHLALKGVGPVHLIDIDLEGSLSSSELNAGGVRATWVLPLHIQMSKQTIDYFVTIADEVGYRACGYLWLHPQKHIEAALQAREEQLKQGWPVEVWDTAELQRRIPFIDKTTDIGVSLFAPRDGLINTNLLKNHFRKQAMAKGATLQDRAWLHQVEMDKASAYPIRALIQKFDPKLSQESLLKVLKNEGTSPQTEQIQARRIINCAGPWASLVAKRIGYSSPNRAIRRQISLFDSREVDLTPYGMIVDPSGVYFHPEGTNGLAGFATSGEPEGVNYHYDGEEFFLNMIWPALYERSSSFEKLKHIGGWAGLYEVSPDECAILGPAILPGMPHQELVFEAHSFSGHGVMHSYSAGLALAERISLGRFETFDATPFSAERFHTGRHLRENLFI